MGDRYRSPVYLNVDRHFRCTKSFISMNSFETYPIARTSQIKGLRRYVLAFASSCKSFEGPVMDGLYSVLDLDDVYFKTLLPAAVVGLWP